MTVRNFSGTGRTPGTIRFTIGSDPHEYVFNPPKTALLLQAYRENLDDQSAVLGSMFEWLGKGLSPEDDKRLADELYGDDPDFDVPELTELIEYLMAEAARRPTKP